MIVKRRNRLIVKNELELKSVLLRSLSCPSYLFDSQDHTLCGGTTQLDMTRTTVTVVRDSESESPPAAASENLNLDRHRLGVTVRVTRSGSDSDLPRASVPGDGPGDS
jgi:hypothetical protein